MGLFNIFNKKKSEVEKLSIRFQNIMELQVSY